MAEKQKRERGLFESERAFRLLVQGVTDYAIYMLDLRGIVANWNAGAERIKGYTAAEVVGRHFGMFYLDEDREAGLPERALETARRTGQFEAEGWRVRKDGTRFFASVVIDALYEDGKLVGFAKITRDITERMHARSALSESESHFRLLVSGVTHYALYMLDPEGIVTNWNLGGQRIKGYLPEEIIGQHFSRFYTPNDREAGKPARALKIAREAGRYEEEGLRVRKDGTFFWASVVIDPIRNDAGELIGFAKITRDITERREAQQQLDHMQRQLAEAQKMDALGQLTGGVAHDFNNLLMVVAGNAMAIKRAVSDPRVAKAVQAIEAAVQRGSSLTSQLLSFARRQHLKPQPINVVDAIMALRDVIRTGLGSAAKLVVEAPDEPSDEPSNEPWTVVVDSAEFETAIVNLVLNARDAMPDGGTVTISIANISSIEKTSLDVGERRGDFVCITVADTGVGIPDDVASRVFDPFFTTKPVGKGTGLGLSQVHGFANQAGGVAMIKSKLGEGTKVTICLPRGQEALQEAENHEAAPRTGTVLLVEDNPDVADASTSLLEELGYRVRWVADADAAILEIERDGIDLMLSDIVMPGKLDGLGLARHVRQAHPQLPILLATGFSDAARKSGHEFPILRKPYQLHELSRALQDLRGA